MVIKLLEGTQGIGVILAPDLKVAEAIIETLQSTRQNVLIQRFVKESKGRDIRALVVGDRVVAAMAEVRAVCEHVHLPLQSGSSAVLIGPLTYRRERRAG